MQLPKYVENTLSQLNKKGFCAYLVGGCVRDSIMGRTPNDYDVTTNALPQQILDVFADEKTLDIGIKHGTVTVVYGKECVEVTTYRIDGEYADNRHPKEVSFTDNIELDLKRRDFTINAIAYSPKDGFVDPFDGKKHISEKKIVCVGNADERFNEDSLRILRGLRFACVLDFEVEDATALSVKENAKLLENISAERINTEFSKLLCGKRVSSVLMQFRDVFEVFLPDVLQVDEDIYNSTCKAVERAKNELCIRLCTFLSMIKDKTRVEPLLKNLKYDNKTVITVCTVLKSMENTVNFDRIGVRKMVCKIGFENTEILFRTYQALGCCNENEIATLFETLYAVQKDNDCVSIKQLAVNGKYLSEKHGLKGRQIGMTLDKLLCAVMEEKCRNNIDGLDEFFREIRSEIDE